MLKRSHHIYTLLRLPEYFQRCIQRIEGTTPNTELYIVTKSTPVLTDNPPLNVKRLFNENKTIKTTMEPINSHIFIAV